MIRLISNPLDYDGKSVLVTGFLRLEFEGNELYLHREDYDESLTKNGVWVEFAPKLKDEPAQFNNHYVLAVGNFNARKLGHRELMSGTLSISNLTAWPPPGVQSGREN